MRHRGAAPKRDRVLAECDKKASAPGPALEPAPGGCLLVPQCLAALGDRLGEVFAALFTCGFCLAWPLGR